MTKINTLLFFSFSFRFVFFAENNQILPFLLILKDFYSDTQKDDKIKKYEKTIFKKKLLFF